MSTAEAIPGYRAWHEARCRQGVCEVKTLDDTSLRIRRIRRAYSDAQELTDGEVFVHVLRGSCGPRCKHLPVAPKYSDIPETQPPEDQTIW
jgi:hypothetical protein